MQLVSIAEKQLIIVGVLFFVMVGISFFLRQFDLLYGHTGAVYGASYTDVNITLWMYRILMVLSIIAAVAFGMGIVKRRFKTAVTVPVLMIVVGLVGTGAGMLIQNFVVSPDEINKEETL